MWTRTRVGWTCRKRLESIACRRAWSGLGPAHPEDGADDAAAPEPAAHALSRKPGADRLARVDDQLAAPREAHARSAAAARRRGPCGRARPPRTAAVAGAGEALPLLVVHVAPEMGADRRHRVEALGRVEHEEAPLGDERDAARGEVRGAADREAAGRLVEHVRHHRARERAEQPQGAGHEPRRPRQGHEPATRVGGRGHFSSTRSIFSGLPATTSTSCSRPSFFSCQTTSVYLPGVTLRIRNAPAASVTAK